MKFPKLTTKHLLLIFLLLLAVTIVFLATSSPSPSPSSPSPFPSPSDQPDSGFNLQPLNPPPSLSPSQQSQLDQQTQDDVSYSQTLQNINQQLPWLTQLPIYTPDYRIVYDFEKKSLRIRILTPPSSDEQLLSIKQQALQSLINIGVNPSVQSYYFLEP